MTARRDGKRGTCGPRIVLGAICAAAILGPAAAWAGGAAAESPGPTPYRIVGDAIPEPLTGRSGDPARGRAIVASRQTGLCLLCHSGPFPEERFQGTLAPSLAGAGLRWTAGQLRLRMVDSSRLNPDSIMPAYFRIDHLRQVGSAWTGRPVLSAEEIEDVVAFLATLGD